MKNEIFFDEIDDFEGGQALRSSLDSFQRLLPEGAYICGCVHKRGRMIWARLQIFIDGQNYSFEWAGNRLIELAQFVEENLVPVLRTWGRSLPEFFRNIRIREGGYGLGCRGRDCAVFNSMKKKSACS